jgi:hypothetical protein
MAILRVSFKLFHCCPHPEQVKEKTDTLPTHLNLLPSAFYLEYLFLAIHANQLPELYTAQAVL